MQDNEQKVVVVDATEKPTTESTSVTNITDKGDDIILLAEQAEQKVNALKKVMTACLTVTSELDWVLISGKPYLQESGCTKIANLIGISFEIVPGFPTITTDERGYKTYTYRVRAFAKTTYVEGEGQRSASEDFFAGKGEKRKAPEEINDRDVRIAALTNAKANAIKSIIPGLKNITIDVLEQAGLPVKKIGGYSHKSGSQGGKTGTEEEFVCEHCGKKINGRVASFSKSKFSNHVYCVDCQQIAAKNKERLTGEVTKIYSENDDMFDSEE